MQRALLLVDIQNDFLPGGALAVPEGDAIIPIVNRCLSEYQVVVATQDWHPRDHQSFASQHSGMSVGQVTTVDGLDQILWPDHCIIDSTGAEFADTLDHQQIAHVIRKGTDKQVDSYSGFFDNARRKDTGLADLLKSLEVSEVDIAGLATDYCVKFTALDAVDLGFKTRLLHRAVRGVELQPGDVDEAIRQMSAAGVAIVE